MRKRRSGATLSSPDLDPRKNSPWPDRSERHNVVERAQLAVVDRGERARRPLLERVDAMARDTKRSSAIPPEPRSRGAAAPRAKG